MDLVLVSRNGPSTTVMNVPSRGPIFSPFKETNEMRNLRFSDVQQPRRCFNVKLANLIFYLCGNMTLQFYRSVDGL